MTTNFDSQRLDEIATATAAPGVIADRSDRIDQLLSALARVQARLRPAKRNANNPFTRKPYADISSIIQAAQDAGLGAEDLAVSQGFEQNPERPDFLTCVSVLGHGSSGQWLTNRITVQLGGKGSSTPAQEVVAGATYARRVGYQSIVGVVAEGEDADGNATEEKGAKAPPREPAPRGGSQPRQSGERLRPPPSGTGIQPAPPRQSGGLEPRDDRAQAHPSYPDPAVRAVEADEREKFQRQERIVHLMRELEPQGFRITRQVNTGRVTLSFPKAIETLGRVVKLDQLNVEDLDWLEKKLTDQIAARAAGGSHPAPAAPSPGPRDRSTRNDPGRPTATEGSRGSRGEPREPGDDDVPPY